MEKLEFKKPYTLSQLINIIKSNIQENDLSNINYCLYSEDDEDFTDSNIIYLESSPTISDEDEEVYPAFVIENSLELFYEGRQFEDVIINGLHQKSTATIDELILGLNYYLDNDTFLEYD
jgi:hypothetical protein